MTGRLAAAVRSRPLWLDIGIGLAVVAGATLVCLALFAVFGTARTGIVFLTSVMLVGATRGLRSSLIAALLATFSYNYFLAGREYEFQLPTDEEFHNLVLFSVAAFFTGSLTGRLRASESSAVRRLTVVDALLHVERVSEDCADEPMLLERITASVAASLPALELTLKSPPAEGAKAAGESTGQASFPVMVGAERVAVIAWTPGPAEFDDFIELLADRVGSHIARMRALQVASRLQLERGRNLLLASVSHDFRTPLATIIAATSSLIDLHDRVDEATRLRLLTAARAEAERLDQFVNQLLEAMRRAPDGVADVAVASIDVVQRLRDVAERFNGSGGWAQVRVSGQPCLILADDMLFSQAFSNVIENAVKHSPVDAPVEVTVSETGARVTVIVEDQGPGVPEADLAGIFERNVQAGSKKKRPGYGIGLAVARFNVNAMGGEIRAANRPSGGLRIIAEFARGG